MPEFIKKTSKKTGLPPGTLMHVGEKKVEEVKINIFDYDEGELQEIESATIDECLRFIDKPTVTWINVYGLHDVETFRKLGESFGLHPLVFEDILTTGPTPQNG
jgi:magnesium transporter